MGAWIRILTLAAFGAGCGSAPAEVVLVREPATGRLLVAARDLGDPNFRHAVILLVHYDEEGAMGVVLNRPSDAPLRRMFPRAETLKTRSDPLYEGGPVMPTGAVAILRARSEPKGAKLVRDDLYLVGDVRTLEEAVNSGKGPMELRVFMGYAGWGPAQLDNEIRMGAWHIFDTDLRTIFDPATDKLWERLIRKTEEHFARNFRRRGSAEPAAFAARP